MYLPAARASGGAEQPPGPVPPARQYRTRRGAGHGPGEGGGALCERHAGGHGRGGAAGEEGVSGNE